MPKSSTVINNSALLDRLAESGRLRERIAERKSMLLFGEQGVGKTRLLQQIVANNKGVLYIAKGHAPREFLLALIDALDRSRGTKTTRSRSLQAMSVCSLKGVAEKELAASSRILIIDHVQSPAAALSSLIKELNYYGRTPIIFAARSPHMEDIGLLRPLCADKTERLELKNWPEAIALEFARRAAADRKLAATNLDSALEAIVEMSHGNPGAITQMIEMARQPRYRHEDQIKFHVLYLDFRMKGAMGVSEASSIRNSTSGI
jgi:hypothetical protein